MSNVAILVAGLLAFAGGAFGALLQRGPVELAGYRVGLRGAAVVEAPPAPAVEPPPALALGSTREQWAYDLALALGNPAPDAATVAFIVAWTRAEDGNDNGALARHNPLNTTQESGAVTMVVNSHGVKGYATREDGMAATVQTLGYGYAGYADIREGIATNDPERALRGLYASPWGTHAALVEQVWRETPAPVTAAPDGPWGNPLNDPRTTLTQGYGVGTHAPAATWGGVDLAWPDVHGAPVYATLAGEARQSTTAMCGNGVEIVAPGWRVLYCHLSAFGQSGPVAPGAVVGYVGNSGEAYGSHLHYEVWRDGVNVNPLEYGAMP